MRRIILAAIPILLAPAAARAQPADPAPPPQPPPGADDSPPPPPPAGDESPPQPEKLADPYAGFAPPLPPRPPIEVQMPVMFNASTGYLPPAGVIIASTGVDTGGGLGADLRLGLGDVAEFGVGTTDLIRTKICDPVCSTSAVQPYPLALFKMGLAEDRLFKNQPALALGFRKSFERDHDDRSSRVAELYLVASKRIGRITRVHAGGVIWDAAVRRGEGDTASEIQLHDAGLRHMLRAYGGIDVEALPRSHLIMELLWAPELRLGATIDQADSIGLTPMFAWGVRYQLADWLLFESGVRVPNIRDVNLLDAQIFGQVRLVSRRFARFLSTDR
ncbi:MAG TPA: hypothetical protein VL172_21665 [Kofleriaceae bacterium]|jgi:hypothetical protein|nr:hypothetical protein [Kofleriaceae bacterium]